MPALPDIRTDDLLLRMEQFRAPHQLQFQGQTSHALKAFARPHPLLVLQTPSRSQAQSVSRRQATLLEIDNTLLTRLHNAGYLPVSPVVLDLGYSPSTSPGSQATIAHGVPGRVYMETQGDGDIENMPLVQPGGEGEDSIRSLHRWMVLLHEAAHCQFEHDGVRFAPTPGLISKLEENALSKWAFSLCGRDGYARRLLHENYADTYASMMLLQATGHTPEAVEIVRRHTSMRY